ncbi:MAG: L-histidine N(alpha)-methyltransferase [Terriglobales bacterium]
MAQTLTVATPHSELLRDVRAGLLCAGQKTLPCKYLYDEVGSLLFEAICALPEYGVTAADERLLRAHAEEIIAPMGTGSMIAELGSGSAHKTRWLLQALCRRQRVTHYWPIEISHLALERSRHELADLPGLELEPLAGEYLDGLRAVLARRRSPQLRGGPLLVLFLGSTLGNFDLPGALDFLCSVRALLQSGDALLLGVDLVKPAARLRLAYDDPAGVTAAFNLNLLGRLNRDLGTDFDLSQWRHHVVYDGAAQRIEMRLRARRAQSIHLPGGEVVNFAGGETIWTESSYKYRAREVGDLLAKAGFRLACQWRDPAWPFAESLALVD